MYIFTSKKKKIIIYNKINSLLEISDILIKYSNNNKVWLIEGSIGSGKTTLISYICKKLGVKNNFDSPTYSLINEYESVNFKNIYHFDFYRVKNYNELYNIDYDYYFYSGNYCFIEWPLKIYDIIPKNCIFININFFLNNRVLEIIYF